MAPVESVSCPLCGLDQAVQVLQVGIRRIVRCRGCGMIYRNPRPSAADVGGAYGVDRGGAHGAAWFGERRGRNFRRFLERWEGPPGRLLDIGCGDGWFLQMAGERGWEAVGIDVSAEAVRQARERFRVGARTGELQSFRFPDGAFDLMTLWNVLEVIPDPVPFLAEVRRVLAPRGTLFIRTQNYLFQRLSFALTGRVPRLRDHVAYIFHLMSFTPSSLRLLLERTGFVSIRVVNSPPTWGDPYRAVGAAEPLMIAGKVAVHAVVQTLWMVSGGRWILGPSLEAYARRGE